LETYKLNKKSFNFSFIYKVVVNSFLLTTAFVFSQDCNHKIEGKIIDLHTNAPLEAAVVQVLGSGDNTISNANGFFVFNNLCLGKVTIKISHINCDNLVREIDLVKSDSFEFKLAHRVEDLDEVIISKLKTGNLSLTNKIYSLSELQKDRFSSKGLADALEQISGVSTLSTGNSIVKPVIHGMFGSRVGIIYDDIFLENQQWGQDHAPNVDLNAFENIRLIKGAGALKYSGSTPGGIVILESVLPKKENSLYGKTKLNGMTNGRGLSLVTNWVKSHKNGFYYKLQGTVKRHGDFSAPSYSLTNTGNNEKNISLIIGKNGIKNNWKFFASFFDAEIGILRSSHISNVRGLFYSIENQIPEIIKPFSYDINFPKQSNRHYTTSLEYSKTYDQDRKTQNSV
jgi:iron complex outermembrane receptor protein